jgi:SAM-dependent methyltransferase
MSEAAIWHDVECGAYSEDLAVWERLAEAHGSPILELGAGTGRVALHLARRGFEVTAADADESLLLALERRARDESLPVGTLRADVRELPAPERPYPLVIGAMQLIQLVQGEAGRRATLAGIARALTADGVAALAIVEGAEGAVGTAGPDTVPDVREVGGWVHSSLPLGVDARNGHLEVRRLRQRVSPDGDLRESEHMDRLDVIDAGALEAEAEVAGLRRAGRLEIAQSELHVGSTVVLLRGAC